MNWYNWNEIKEKIYLMPIKKTYFGEESNFSVGRLGTPSIEKVPHKPLSKHLVTCVCIDVNGPYNVISYDDIPENISDDELFSIAENNMDSLAWHVLLSPMYGLYSYQRVDMYPLSGTSVLCSKKYLNELSRRFNGDDVLIAPVAYEDCQAVSAKDYRNRNGIMDIYYEGLEDEYMSILSKEVFYYDAKSEQLKQIK